MFEEKTSQRLDKMHKISITRPIGNYGQQVKQLSLYQNPVKSPFSAYKSGRAVPKAEVLKYPQLIIF
jgi:hypothetical protein